MAKIYDISDKQARLPLAYGRHSVRGVLVRHETLAVGSDLQVTLQQALGVGEWDSVEKLAYGSDAVQDLDAANYTFHAGGATDAADTFFPTDPPHPNAAYINVRLPIGVSSDNNPDLLLGIYKGLKIADYDAAGSQTAFNFSANPARVAADIIKRARPRLLQKIDWAAWRDWRDWCAALISTTVNNQVVSVPRFETHVFIVPPFSLKAALDKICQITCSDWQWRGGYLRFLAPVSLASVFNFNLDEVSPADFKWLPADRKSRPNLVRVFWRDLDHPYLKEADPFEVKRTALIARDGGAENALEINVGVARKSQVERVANYWARLRCDLADYASLVGSWKSYPVLPGDVVTVTHDVPDFTSVQFRVMEKEEDEDGGQGYPIKLQYYPSNPYSDADQSPITTPVVPPRPNPFAPPPAPTLALSAQQNIINADGTVNMSVLGSIAFGNFGFAQRAKVFWKKPSGAYELLIEVTPDAANQAVFRAQNLMSGVHYFKVVAVSAAGVTQTSAADEKNITIAIDPTPPAPPSNLTAVFNGLQITFNFDPSPTPTVKGYRVTDENDAILLSLITGTSFTLAANKPVIKLKVFAVSVFNVLSSDHVYIEFVTPPALKWTNLTNAIIIDNATLLKSSAVAAWDAGALVNYTFLDYGYNSIRFTADTISVKRAFGFAKTPNPDSYDDFYYGLLLDSDATLKFLCYAQGKSDFITIGSYQIADEFELILRPPASTPTNQQAGLNIYRTRDGAQTLIGWAGAAGDITFEGALTTGALVKFPIYLGAALYAPNSTFPPNLQIAGDVFPAKGSRTDFENTAGVNYDRITGNLSWISGSPLVWSSEWLKSEQNGQFSFSPKPGSAFKIGFTSNTSSAAMGLYLEFKANGAFDLVNNGVVTPLGNYNQLSVYHFTRLGNECSIRKDDARLIHGAALYTGYPAATVLRLMVQPTGAGGFTNLELRKGQPSAFNSITGSVLGNEKNLETVVVGNNFVSNIPEFYALEKAADGDPLVISGGRITYGSKAGSQEPAILSGGTFTNSNAILPSAGKTIDINPHSLGLADNSPVTSFTDGAGVAFTGNCVNRTNQANGKSGFNFNGSTNFLKTSASLDLSATDKITVCAFLRVSGTEGGILWEHGADLNSNTSFFALPNANNQIQVGASGGGSSYNIFQTSESFSDYKTLIHTHDRSLSTNEASVRVAAAASGGTRPNNDNLSGSFLSAILNLGARNAGSTAFQSYYLCRLIIYNRILNPAEITDVESAFDSLYGASKLQWTAFRLINIPTAVAANQYIAVAANSAGVALADGEALFYRYFGIEHAQNGTGETFTVALDNYIPTATKGVYEFLIAKRQAASLYLRDGRAI